MVGGSGAELHGYAAIRERGHFRNAVDGAGPVVADKERVGERQCGFRGSRRGAPNLRCGGFDQVGLGFAAGEEAVETAVQPEVLHGADVFSDGGEQAAEAGGPGGFGEL